MSQTAREESADARLKVHAFAQVDARARFAEDVRCGLAAAPKRLQPKYFYDQLGSLLFDAICLLPEYYLTRAEDEILRTHADEIVAAVAGGGGARLSLLEFGSGSAVKTRLLIEAILRRQPRLLYRPVDISATALEVSARALLQSYAQLGVEAYAGDYDAALSRLRRDARGGGGGRDANGRTLALFLGSNVGNFEPAEAERFLTDVRACLRAADALLLGADLKKDPSVLLAAYDDPLGLTAAFNLNLLARINRELAADFDLRGFRHRVRYEEPAGRIEIYAESLRAQTVVVRELGLTVEFAAGEWTHTENSHKYDPAQLKSLAATTGFELSQTWTDAAGRFSSNLFVAV